MMNTPFALLLFIPLLLAFFPSSFSLTFDILQFDNITAGISYQGDARPVKGYVDLTITSEYFRVGRVVYSEPVYLFNTATGMIADFTTEFNFSIEITDRGRYSDGLTFFIAPANYHIPPNSGGGFFGLLNLTTGALFKDGIIMVEFDTYPNREYDPLTSHVGINVNSIASVVNASWDALAESGKTAQCRISYNARMKNLSVAWTYAGSALSVENQSLWHVVDLSKVLPEWVTIGFSAATGLFPERHIIHSWRFASNLNPNPTNKLERKSARFHKLFMETLASACLLVLLLILLAFCFIRVNQRKGRKDVREGLGDSSITRDIERRAFLRKFSYNELYTATSGFSSVMRLSSGHVYRGYLSDLDCTVVVKRVFAEDEHSQRFFINEVRIFGRLIHQNLVRFIGWCHENEEYLLVYKYVPNGSLDSYLFGNRRPLPWNVRHKIALGLATALHYLHEEAGQCVLHRDVKSANVLLDIDFNAKLGGFGLARRINPQSGTQSTTVVGSHEYLAPEYIRERSVSKQSDIFSFGVVALEIASGRKIYSDGENTVPLVKWVWQLYDLGRVTEAADKQLRMGFDNDEMERLLVVGLWCTHPNDRERPSAREVIKLLKREIPLPELATAR
ncbi:hypothetical protein MLD38_016092 [Melastoma candidum]|uniref:Uncharacterized protein n=1 Tax=Melastoma candidum TaxID=119954 RepID=A0ACB9RIF9_9MYRT|nr:hypothetical protein MLD38_016092 [Melastoma candidum]